MITHLMPPVLVGIGVIIGFLTGRKRDDASVKVWKALKTLSQKDRVTAGDIAAATKLKLNTVYVQLERLQRAGWVGYNAPPEAGDNAAAGSYHIIKEPSNWPATYAG